MAKIAIVGYLMMIISLIVSTLYIYGFIPFDALSITMSLTPLWMWGLISILLLWTRELDGLLLSSGFITFTIFVSLVIFFTTYLFK